MDNHQNNEQIKKFSKHLEENKKKIKHIKQTCSNRVYLSHPERNQNPFNWNSAHHFKSSSMVTLQTPVNLQSNYEEAQKDDFSKNSFTQTSKTILQLAQLESDGRISPDSLMQSPKEEYVVSTNKLLDFIPTKITSRESTYPDESIGDGNFLCSQNSVTYSRKKSMQMYLNNLKHNVGDAEINQNYDTCFKNDKMNAEGKSRKSSASNIRSKFLQQSSPLRNITEKSDALKNSKKKSRFSVKSVAERVSADVICPVKYYTQKLIPHHANVLKSKSIISPINTRFKTKRSNSFMSPTIASEIKNKQSEIHDINSLISATKRGRSSSPVPHKVSNRVEKFCLDRVPYIDMSEDQSVSTLQCRSSNERIISSNKTHPLTAKPIFEDDLLRIDNLSLNIESSDETIVDSCKIKESTSGLFTDNAIYSSLTKLRNPEWSISLKGLAEIVDLARLMDTDLIYPHMIYVNQRLIELLRSPRSHVCRTACQAAGHLFESVKDVRRPEFDDIVDLLLFKTADANKFIRQDANLSLDCMVTHIPTFHAIRTLCSKGPDHKNPLVRIATIRLIVCAVVIAGADSILNIHNNENTRKRVILQLFKFLEDKNIETRKYGERLYKILYKEPHFDMFLRKYLEKEQIHQMKKNLKFLHLKK